MKKNKENIVWNESTANRSIVVVKTQASKAIDYAQGLVINSDKEYEGAMEQGKKIKEVLSKMEERRDEITRPLNEALKSARSLFKPIETALEGSLREIKTKMMEYYKQKTESIRKEQENITARVERGTMKIETAMEKLQNTPTIQKTIETKNASVTMKTLKKLRVIDKTKIPLEFMEPDMVKIKASFREGRPVNGVEEYTELEPSIS